MANVKTKKVNAKNATPARRGRPAKKKVGRPAKKVENKLGAGKGVKRSTRGLSGSKSQVKASAR